ncbi:MAG: hypothetical protein NZL98_03475 [Anaerolineales bacterium]|nr:hypothetical protein [Anaerolineales bacterium]MDW8228172.1 hypothetical protein [Anaerolineales bacterium]
MCMFCAAIPTAAATGVMLDSQQRRSRQKRGLPPQRVRPFAVLTVLTLLILAVGSAVFHSKFPTSG